jgi:hypothetical protein
MDLGEEVVERRNYNISSIRGVGNKINKYEVVGCSELLGYKVGNSWHEA